MVTAATRRASYRTIHAYYVIGVYYVSVISMVTALTSQRDYSGSQNIRVEVSDLVKWKEFYRELQALGSTQYKVADVWRHPTTNSPADLHVQEDDVTRAKQLLRKFGLKYHVIVDDFGSLLEREHVPHRLKRSKGINDVIGHYARYQDIVGWMDDVITRYPTIAKVIDIGVTSEGRRMKVLKLGTSGRGKWKVWVDGGIHAREWISPATVLYIANQLLNGYTKKVNSTTEFLQTVDWYFLPVVNPDGYEFSHTQDRLWRKNRKLDNVTGCHGVDLNRNWKFQWGAAYSSKDPCDNEYRGSSPEDELEVRNIVNFLSSRADGFIAFLTYHSYGQRFITRWDYSKEVIPTDHDQLMSLAKRAVSVMQTVHGTVYEAGRAPELMYPYGGGSPDWAKAIANIKYSYLIELRNEHSFILPTEEIVPTGEENWAAMRVIAREILDYYGDIPAPHVDDPPYWSRDDNHVTYKHENEVDRKMAVVFQVPDSGASRVYIVNYIISWLLIWSLSCLCCICTS